MQYRIVGVDLDATPLVVSCPRCKAEPGQPCHFKGPSTRHRPNPRTHLRRGDKAERQRIKDLYGCHRCEYACDCSPNAPRWLPVMTTIARNPP